MSKRCVLVVAVLLVFSQTARMQKSRTLDIYSIDVEGGQATLFVSPSGESLLVDAGNPGDRDADRIAASAKERGRKNCTAKLRSAWACRLAKAGSASQGAAPPLRDGAMPAIDPFRKVMP